MVIETIVLQKQAVSMQGNQVQNLSCSCSCNPLFFDFFSCVSIQKQIEISSKKTKETNKHE